MQESTRKLFYKIKDTAKKHFDSSDKNLYINEILKYILALKEPVRPIFLNNNNAMHSLVTI